MKGFAFCILLCCFWIAETRILKMYNVFIKIKMQLKEMKKRIKIHANRSEEWK